ncbi:MAG: serine protease, partial [Clostridia bacterium]|nr:serine protease [Clostridia bacterium]
MAGVEPRQLGDPGAVKEADAAAAADFAVRLFRACADGGENVLVSPLSVLAALSMTANGAKG